MEFRSDLRDWGLGIEGGGVGGVVVGMSVWIWMFVCVGDWGYCSRKGLMSSEITEYHSLKCSSRAGIIVGRRK